jgi:hypothetical protein
MEPRVWHNGVNAINGVLKVRRGKKAGNETLLIIRVKMKPSEFLVYLIGESNGAGLYRWPPRREVTANQSNIIILSDPGPKEKIEPEQAEVSVILD